MCQDFAWHQEYSNEKRHNKLRVKDLKQLILLVKV